MERIIFVAIACITILLGCSNSKPVDQSKLCIISTDDQAKKCTSGELVYFKPQQWGNEQLPLDVAAVYCDFNHAVMHTNGGLICVFTKQRLSLLEKK